MDKLDLGHKYWNVKYKSLYKKLGDRKYSEHQEDGIIEAVFKKYKPKYKYFVDIGAYGKQSSNTWALMEQGWQGIMVESSKTQALELNTIVTPKIKSFMKHITQDNLEDLLLEQGVPYDFDFLSVDIDSYEYEVWKNLTIYKPRLVCIEVNQQETDFKVVNYDPSFSVVEGGYGGATIGLMNRLAEDKGYDYLCWDVSNAFYIRR